MIRLVVVLMLLAGTASVVLAYGDPDRIVTAQRVIKGVLANRPIRTPRTVEIARSSNGEFALRAKINGVTTPMVIDTGATSVVLTWETAKAAGLPLELLDYNIELETASGHTRVAQLTLDRLAIGKLVERSVPALVAPKGQLNTNLLGMSFLDRLESWEVHTDRLKLRGYP